MALFTTNMVAGSMTSSGSKHARAPSLLNLNLNALIRVILITFHDWRRCRM